MTITEQTRAMTDEILYELDHRWFGSVSERRKDAVAAIITKHAQAPSVTEAIDCVKRLRDEWSAEAVFENSYGNNVKAANAIINALESLQGKAGVSEYAKLFGGNRNRFGVIAHNLVRDWLQTKNKEGNIRPLPDGSLVVLIAKALQAATTPASVEAPRVQKERTMSITNDDLAVQLQQSMTSAFMVGHSDGSNKEYRVEIRFSTLREMQHCHTLLIALSDPSSRQSFLRQGLIAPKQQSPRVCVSDDADKAESD